MNFITRYAVVVWVVLVLTLSALISYVPEVNAAPTGNITGTVTYDFSDTDGDGKYNYLLVNVEVEVSEPGSYYLRGDLYAGATYITYDSKTAYLSAGIGYVQLVYSGRAIYDRGMSGLYSLKNLELRYSSTTLDSVPQIDVDNFNYTYFQGDYISIVSGADEGLDSDGDGYYDLLHCTITFIDSIGGHDLAIYNALYSGGNYVTYSYAYNITNAGVNTVDVYFSGSLIYSSGLDGPYNVRMYFYQRPEWDTVHSDTTSIVTKGYNHTAFEPPSVEILYVEYDHGLDIDGNGLYDYFVVGIRVRVNDFHRVRISTNLYTQGGTSLGSANYYFTPTTTGEMTVELTWPGYKIYKSGESGTLRLSSISVYDYDVGNYVEWHSGWHYLGSYDFMQFEPPSIAFTGDYGDYLSDRPDDGDDYYDALVFKVGVNVTKANDYRIYGQLYWNGYYVAGRNTYVTLSPGFHYVELRFDESILKAIDYGTDPGPYIYELHFVRAYNDSGESMDYAYPSYYSSPYSLSEFTPPHATFTGDYFDYGEDTDSVEGYDAVTVEVGINVNISGYYTVRADIYTENMAYITTETVGQQLAKEKVFVKVHIPLEDFMWGNMYSGRLLIHTLRLVKSGVGLIEQKTDPYLTNYYDYHYFDPPLVRYTGIFEDMGVDQDSDGDYEYLLVRAGIEAQDTGIFKAYMEVYDYYWNLVDTVWCEVEVWDVRYGGGAWAEFYIPAGSIAERAMETPLILTEFTLYDGLVAVSTYDGAVYTHPYPLDSFQGKPSGPIEGKSVSITPHHGTMALDVGQTGRYGFTILNLLNRPVQYEIYFSDVDQLDIHLEREVDGLPLQDDNLNGFPETDIIAPFGYEDITLVATLAAGTRSGSGDGVEGGMVFRVVIMAFEWVNHTNIGYTSLDIGVGYSPHTFGTEATAPSNPQSGYPPTPSTGTTPGSSGVEGSSPTAPTFKTTGKETAPSEAEVRTTTVSYDGGNVVCNVRYKGTGSINVHYVTSPSGDRYRNVGIGRYIEITAPATMDIVSIEIIIKYDKVVESRLDEGKLRMYYWDEDGGKWERVKDTWVDTERNEVHARVGHLTVFSAFQSEALEGLQSVSPEVASGILVTLSIAIVISIIVLYSKVSKETRNAMRKKEALK